MKEVVDFKKIKYVICCVWNGGGWIYLQRFFEPLNEIYYSEPANPNKKTFSGWDMFEFCAHIIQISRERGGRGRRGSQEICFKFVDYLYKSLYTYIKWYDIIVW